MLIKQSLQHRTGARERSTIEEGIDFIHLNKVYLVHFHIELKFTEKRKNTGGISP